MATKKSRIQKSEKYLAHLLADGDQFYVGVDMETYEQSPSLEKYGLPKEFSINKSLLPNKKGPVSKVNVLGKFERKQPEEKTIKEVEIDYVNKYGTHVNYMREYNVYVKVLAHMFKLNFIFRENEHGQKMLVSPRLIFDNTVENNIKNTHAINLFLEVFGEFEVYTKDLEPAIAFNTKYDFDILPKGEFEDDDINYIVEGARRFVKKEEQVYAFQKRLRVIQEFNPTIKGKGPAGFWGYIVFGFPDRGFVILETMYNSNATYVFDIKTYEDNIGHDKQYILQNRLAKRRFYHHDNWENNIRAFLKSR